MDSTTINDVSPLAADLKAENPDHYLAILFAPPAVREALTALYAFAGEVSRVRRVVREPIAGLIRLQWWDDVIDGLESGKTVAHPVVDALRRAVGDAGLDMGALKRVIDGHRRPFEMEVPPSLSSFECYLTAIGGDVARAAAVLLGAHGPDVLNAASRVGLVRAAWDQLRALEIAGPERRIWLPSPWLGEADDGADDAVWAGLRSRFAAWSLEQLADARRQAPSIARPHLAAFLSGTLAGARLQDPVRASRQPMLPSAVPRLAWCWMRGRF